MERDTGGEGGSFIGYSCQGDEIYRGLRGRDWRRGGGSLSLLLVKPSCRILPLQLVTRGKLPQVTISGKEKINDKEKYEDLGRATLKGYGCPLSFTAFFGDNAQFHLIYVVELCHNVEIAQ